MKEGKSKCVNIQGRALQIQGHRRRQVRLVWLGQAEVEGGEIIEEMDEGGKQWWRC